METANQNTELKPAKVKVIELDSPSTEKGKLPPNGIISQSFIPSQRGENTLETGKDGNVEEENSFDLDNSIEEIKTLVSKLQNDKNFKNVNFLKIETAISVGKIIVEIHNNVKDKDTRSKVNNKIKTILGRERSTLQDYKRLTYFEDTNSLANLGIAGAAKVCGHLRNYNKITNNTFLNVKDILEQIDSDRCINDKSLLQFEEEISNKSSSVFCKEIVIKEAKEKFGNDVEFTIPNNVGIKVSDAKELIENLDKYDKDTFADIIVGIDKKIKEVSDDKKIEQQFKKHIEALRIFVDKKILKPQFYTAIDTFESEIKKIIHELRN